MPFSFRIDKNHNSEGNENVDCGVNNQPFLALKMSKEPFKMRLRHFSGVCINVNSFL